MRQKFFFSMAAIITLVMLPPAVNAVYLELGPFSFRLNGGVELNSPAFSFYQEPICRAIQQHKLVVLYVQNNSKTEQVVLQPYLFGYDTRNNLVLQGYQVESVDITDMDNEVNEGEGFFGGIFSSFKGDKWKDINFDKVVSINVIEDSSFQVRENALDNISEDNKVIEPLCFIRS
ncbi:MAG: hypothetical protein VX777_02945 [Chlamydiota bacterium]|nr:hypothetical protein [Chlamydiota bacterium]